MANPTSSATNSVCSTDSPVSGDTRVVGMMPSRNSVVVCASPPAAFSAAARPASLITRPSPGCRMLPTSRPMISATVDIAMK